MDINTFEQKAEKEPQAQSQQGADCPDDHSIENKNFSYAPLGGSHGL